jgi:endonuclease/exonuclease/phosphatase family metal-dependent hydrolase
VKALALLLALCAIALPASAGEGAASFSLVTLNLYHDKDDWPRRRQQIVDTLRPLQPDAIALQEVLQDHDLPNQAAWLAHELGYHWHFATTDPPSQARRYGNALLTRQAPLERAETLLHPLQDYRAAGMVRIEFDGRPLNLYVTHLHWTPEGGAMRARQLQDLLAWIDATAAGGASVVAGDFNAPPQAPELAVLLPRFANAWDQLHAGTAAAAASTLNPHYHPQPARIDHVFLEQAYLVPVEASLLFEEPDADGAWASDHRGVLVRFRRADAP